MFGASSSSAKPSASSSSSQPADAAAERDAVTDARDKLASPPSPAASASSSPADTATAAASAQSGLHNGGSNNNNNNNKPASFNGGAIEVSFEEDEVTVEDDDDGNYDDQYGEDEDDRGSSVDGEEEDEEEDEDEDEDEFEEYTVYDEETVAAATVHTATARESNAKVKLYNEGATPLFLLIEESHWHKALSYITREACETWVQSTGTMATTFQWSLWRRLPLHEACRRQAPAWFVSRLLREFPEAACQPTQFGELPIHLAVECGAPPEVVNLLLVAHWPGIAAKDQSGRTPLEILRDVELLNVEDASVVLESLERSHGTWTDLQRQMKYEKQQLEAAHRRHMKQAAAQHETEMAEELQQHADLIEQVQHLTVLLERLQDTTVTQQHRIDSLTGVETSWRERVDALERSLEVSRAETSGKKDEVATLARMLVQKNRHVEALEAEGAHLKADLHAASGLQHDLAAIMAAAERDLHQLVTSYCAAQDTLAQHHRDLRGVVQQRGAYAVDPSRSSLWKEEPPAIVAAPSTTAAASDAPSPSPSSSPRRSPSSNPHLSTPPRKPSSSHSVNSSTSNGGSPHHQSKYRKSSAHNGGGSTMKEDEKKQDDSSSFSASVGRSGGSARMDDKSNDHDNDTSYAETDNDEAMARAAKAASTALLSSAAK
jgi:hypothetical protein